MIPSSKSVATGLRGTNMPAATIKQFQQPLGRTMKADWFGIGITIEGGKHLPIHRNSRTQPSPRVRTSLVTGKQFQLPDTFGRYVAGHLAGERLFSSYLLPSNGTPYSRSTLMATSIVQPPRPLRKSSSSFGRSSLIYGTSSRSWNPADRTPTSPASTADC
jgi:hypothetical protein